MFAMILLYYFQYTWIMSDKFIMDPDCNFAGAHNFMRQETQKHLDFLMRV